MPATLFKAMYFSAVMKVPSSWGQLHLPYASALLTRQRHPLGRFRAHRHTRIVSEPVEQPAPPGEALAVADVMYRKRGPAEWPGP
jgi:hypothetical protein